VQLQLTPVPLDQLGERIRVASLCPGDKLSIDENPPLWVATRDSVCPAIGIDAVATRNRAPLPTFLAAGRLHLRQTAAAEPEK
jgi:hypothetical protein